MPQDVQLWEDLSELEGRLGMRYLTHESEDAFWTRQGAKQHPLAKKEEAKREEMQRMNAIYSDNSPGKTRKGVHFSNGTALGGSGVCVENSSSSEEVKAEETVEETVAQQSRGRSSLVMSDEEIRRSQQHAERIGYKVSSV